MSTREVNTATTIAAMASIVVIVCVACFTGHNDTLIKIGIAAIAGLGGFSLANMMRRNPV